MRTSLALPLLLAAPALAQLTPDRTYYGIGRDIPMTVKTPADSKGEIVIQLLEVGAAKVFASAPAAAGAVNMATLFPQLWSDKPAKVLYAQLLVGEQKIGPAVVIEPLGRPVTAYPPEAPRQPVRFVSAPPSYSGVRAYVDQHVVMETTAGTIEIELRPDVAANTVWNFRDLVAGGFYTDVKFHRIVPLVGPNPFVIQAGDLTGTGQGGSGRNIPLEHSTLPHDFGVISMARTSDPNTGGSQFFLCLSREGTAALDNDYCSFGQTVAGGKAILDIAAVPLSGQTPQEPAPRIKSARLVDAPPYGTGPKPQTREAAEGKTVAPEKPAEAKPAESKPAEVKPAEPKPAGGQS